LKIVAVVNPAAGAGAATGRWEACRTQIEGCAELEVQLSERPGHATRLTEEAFKAGADRVLAVGGDGTWHECLQGLMSLPESDREKRSLGTVPVGSGCDFARHMQIPSDPEECGAVVTSEDTRLIDIVEAQFTEDDGGLGRTWLSNMASFGIGGDVAQVVDRFGKPLGGTATYLAATVACALRSQGRRFQTLLDDVPLPGKDIHTVILANTSTTGGGMRVAPEADAADGLFEVVSVCDVSRLSLLSSLSKIYDGSHLGEKGVTLLQGKRLEARVKDGRPAWLNIDGELKGMLPAVFVIRPSAIAVCAP